MRIRLFNHKRTVESVARGTGEAKTLCEYFSEMEEHHTSISMGQLRAMQCRTR